MSAKMEMELFLRSSEIQGIINNPESWKGLEELNENYLQVFVSRGN
jgi:hypothetical protein